MNLYEINAAIMAAYEGAVDEETGEIIENDAYAALEGLQMEFERKAEGILLWIKNLKAEAEALKKEKMAFADRQARAERKAESLKTYISGVLAGQKFQTDKVAVSWRKSETIEVSCDPWSLKPEYLRLVDPEPNKTALKAALKAGEVIDGVELIEKRNIQIK